jgi:O-antigen ligase
MQKVYRNLVSVAVIISVYLDLGNYLDLITLGRIKPKEIYLALAVANIPIAIQHSRQFVAWITSPITVWIATFVLLNMISYLVDTDASGLIAKTATTRSAIISTLWMGAFSLTVETNKLKMRAFATVLIASIALLVVDLIAQGTIYPIEASSATPGRAAGTFINSNKAAEAMLITLLLTLTWQVGRKKGSAILVGLAFIGTLTTFSRSGFIAFIGTTACLLASGALSRRSALITICTVLAGSLMVIVNEDRIISLVTQAGSSDIAARITNLRQFKANDDGSLTERMAVAREAWNDFKKSPIVGVGPGKTYYGGAYNVASHNMHLMLLAEYGLTGYLTFAWLLVLLCWRLIFTRGRFNAIGLAMFFTILAFSVTTHNMLDHPYWIVTFLIISGSRKAEEHHTFESFQAEKSGTRKLESA